MIAIIGCGNLNRRDDGAGPEAIRALKARGAACDGVQLFDAGTDGMSVMFAARGASTLVVIDAARSGAEPGAVFEVPGAELERPYVSGFNLHDFRWDAALHAGRRIFREAFPDDVIVLLVEAQEVSLGLGLTAPVAAAVDTIVARIEQIIAARTASGKLRLERGGLYFARDLWARHFDGLESVVLLRRSDDLVIAPVRNAAAGGYLLKQRNAAGDRVVQAPDFFREHGLDDAEVRTLHGVWREADAAFVVPDAFVQSKFAQEQCK